PRARPDPAARDPGAPDGPGRGRPRALVPQRPPHAGGAGARARSPPRPRHARPAARLPAARRARGRLRRGRGVRAHSPRRRGPRRRYPPDRQRRSGRRAVMTSHPTGPTSKLSLLELAERKANGAKLVMVTAYDHPGAKLADAAGVDLILVGD